MNEDFIKDILAKVGLFKITKKIFGQFLYKYKNYKFKKEAYNALKKIKQILEEEEIIFWLEFGTLLGAVRDNDFIKHDFDIDLGCLTIEKREVLKDKLEKNGFKYLRKIIIQNGEKICEETYSYKNKLNIDFFYFYPKENKIIFYDFEGEENLSFNETIKRKGGLICYSTEISNFELKKYNFKGLEFNIPAETTLHLKELYGEEFMIPDSKWKPNMRKNRMKLDIYGKVEK